MKIKCLLFVVIVFGTIIHAHGQNPQQSEMKVTILGTGTPYPDSQRFGSAILVEAGNNRVLFDSGRGATIRLHQAGVSPDKVDALFLTHLHSDHIVGIPDLWLTGWFMGRRTPLKVFGPPGTIEMTTNLNRAFSFDQMVRAKGPGALPSFGSELNASEVKEGTVYEHGALRVTAFEVDHGPVKPAFGYRVDYFGNSVVISGDTKYSANLVRYARGATCLIHVAWQPDARNRTPSEERSMASAEDALRVFSLVKPKLALIYHYLDDSGISDVIQEKYSGNFVVATDLTNIRISNAGVQYQVTRPN
jgi:ribonuclease Z